MKAVLLAILLIGGIWWVIDSFNYDADLQNDLNQTRLYAKKN